MALDDDLINWSNTAKEKKVNRRSFIKDFSTGLLALTAGASLMKGLAPKADAAAPPKQGTAYSRMQTQDNYHFHGTLVDVTDREKTLADKVIEFRSPEGVSYTVTTDADGNFSKDINNTAIDDFDRYEEPGYRSLSTGYKEGIKNIRFEAPSNARRATVRVFNILGQEVDEANYNLSGSGCFSVPWQKDVASGIYLAQVQIEDNTGRTHYLGNIKIQNRAGNNGNGFLISDNSTIRASEKPSNAVVVYDEAKEKKRLLKANNGNQWTMIISDPSGEYVTHKKYFLPEEGDNELLEDMLPNDETLLGLLNGSMGRDGYYDYYKRWAASPEKVYINSDNVAQNVQDNTIDYLTNGTIDTLTRGKIHIDSDSIKVVPGNQLPTDYDNKILIDNYGEGSYFAVWEDTEGSGRINKAYVNLSNSSTKAIILSELAGILADAGDYDEISSITNDLPTLEEPIEIDIKAFNYIYNRRPGTGTDDDETRPGDLEKAMPSLDYNSLSPERQQIVDRLEKIYGSRPSSIRFLD